MKHLLVLSVGLVVGAAWAAPTEAEVRREEVRANGLAVELDALRHRNALLETKIEALTVTGDLVSGRRTAPPRAVLEERLACRPYPEKVTIDNRADGKRRIVEKWIALPRDGKYRVRARMAIREISGTRNFKFGCMIPVLNVRTDWPAAEIGGAPFAEKEVSFDFEKKKDSSVLLLMGFETGRGLAEIEDVRIYELTEVVK